MSGSLSKQESDSEYKVWRRLGSSEELLELKSPVGENKHLIQLNFKRGWSNKQDVNKYMIPSMTYHSIDLKKSRSWLNDGPIPQFGPKKFENIVCRNRMSKKCKPIDVNSVPENNDPLKDMSEPMQVDLTKEDEAGYENTGEIKGKKRRFVKEKNLRNKKAEVEQNHSNKGRVSEKRNRPLRKRNNVPLVEPLICARPRRHLVLKK